jgi:hypothetical protein
MQGYMNGMGSGTVPGFENFLKLTDIGQATQYYIFLDEKPSTINDEYFEVLMPAGASPTTPPASIQVDDNPSQVHNYSCGFGFADGHSEMHKWLGPAFQSSTSCAGSTFNSGTVNYNDAYWLTQHTTYATP